MPISKRTVQRRKHWLNRYKRAKGCAFCGYDEHHHALQFDHHKGDKHKGIPRMVEKHSLKKVFDEVRKCRVLCANCHTILSSRQARERYGYESPDIRRGDNPREQTK